METEAELNALILDVTLRIKEQYPELSKYIEEMRDTIPDEKDPGITTAQLRAYYDSLNAMLMQYAVGRSHDIAKKRKPRRTRLPAGTKTKYSW